MPGDQPWDEKASVLSTLLADLPHRTVDGQQTIVLPNHPTLLVVASEVPTALELTESARSVCDPLTASPLGGTYSYRMWSNGTSWQETVSWQLPEQSAAWASGARLLGYHVEGAAKPGGTVRATLWWETSQGAPDVDVHWFNHLVDAQGAKWAQHDHAAWPSHKWRSGDQVVNHFHLTIDGEAASGPYWLRVGQYAYPDVVNIPLLDQAGDRLGDWVLLPVVTTDP
jgi:hypothetical protein